MSFAPAPSGYSYVKAAGRLSVYLDGEFSHQQFRSHWAFRDPARYIASLVAADLDAAAESAVDRRLRVARARLFLADRVRAARRQPDLFGFDPAARSAGLLASLESAA